MAYKIAMSLIFGVLIVAASLPIVFLIIYFNQSFLLSILLAFFYSIFNMSVYFLSVLKTDFTFKKLLYKHIFTHFTQMLKPAGQNVFLSAGFMHIMYILCIILIQCFLLRYGYCRFIAGEDLLYALLIRFLCDQTDDRNKDQSTDHRCCTTVYR